MQKHKKKGRVAIIASVRATRRAEARCCFWKVRPGTRIRPDYGLSSRPTTPSALSICHGLCRGNFITSRRSTSPSRRGKRSCRQERQRPGSDRSWLAPVINMYVICSIFVLKSTEQSSTIGRFRVAPETRVKERLKRPEGCGVMPGIHRAYPCPSPVKRVTGRYPQQKARDVELVSAHPRRSLMGRQAGPTVKRCCLRPVPLNPCQLSASAITHTSTLRRDRAVPPARPGPASPGRKGRVP